MRHFHIGWIYLPLLLLWATGGYAGEEIDLGGLRKAKVKIVRTKTHWEVRPEFLSVTAFDGSTNLKLNRTKARGYALLALHRHMKLTDEVIQVSEVSYKVDEAPAGRFSTVCLIPFDGIRIIDSPINEQAPDAGMAGQASPRPAKTERMQSDFLGRRDDYLDTIANLQRLVTESMPEKNDGSDGFYDACYDAEMNCEDRFAELTAAIQNDRFLLSMEREEICVEIRKSRNAVLSEITSRSAVPETQ